MGLSLTRGLAAGVLLCAVASSAYGQDPVVARGTLVRGDATLRSGEYYDEHYFTAEAGQRASFDLTTSAFDPYIVVVSPSGERKENDDWEGSGRRARVEIPSTEAGRYRVLVTSFKRGDSGPYELRTTFSAGGGAAVSTTPGRRVENGELASGDGTLNSGEYYDEYTFQGRAGEAVTVDLRSTGFDPYLLVVGPGSFRQQNDDYESDRQRSLVTFDVPEAGTYRVIVTSYAERETGNYNLSIHQPVGTAPGPAVSGPRVERGRLEASDRTIASGEYMDAYTFEGRPGQRVSLDLVSSDFDTYLILSPVRGEQHENDDADDDRGHSRIEADISEVGPYTVLVTSYNKGEVGAYELRVNVADTVATANTTEPSGRDLGAITYGAPQAGQLQSSDARIQSGAYRDVYAFDGRAGEQVVVELTSSSFDPYLVLTPPGGEAIDNDDAGGRLDMSRIELTLPSTGRYRVLVTSYAADETGDYRLVVRRDGVASVNGRGGSGAATTSAGRVFGVFIGISDYGNRASDLEFTAGDARRMQAALLGNGMRQADSILLTDRQATRAGLRRALEQVAQRATSNDTFVFFYSGHGGRERRATPQAVEADGQDETLTLFDDDVTDDELSEWMAGIQARSSLIVLDSCFSGGFQKDLITAPHVRMGLFSSEEDVTSSIATKFKAGGYLAYFFAEAIADRRGDLDGNGEITAIELSQYLRERYRSDVKSGSADDDFVRVGGRQLGYQHLVVDRGGVRPNDVLFRLP